MNHTCSFFILLNNYEHKFNFKYGTCIFQKTFENNKICFSFDFYLTYTVNSLDLSKKLLLEKIESL